MDILSIFVTGLFAGGLTCLAVQGGLLATSIAQTEDLAGKHKAHLSEHILPVASFLIMRLIAYTLFGALLGYIGSFAQLSIGTRALLQIVVSIFMLGTAMNLLNVHPIFRYFILQPPKKLARLIRNQSKSKNIFAPAILGAMTILIPCGATQAMMAFAVSTGSPLLGAMTMFIFISGTSPLFFIFGLVAKKLGERFSKHFNKAAAFALIAIGLFNLYGALTISGKTQFLSDAVRQVKCTISICSDSTAYSNNANSNTVSQATIYFSSAGYTTQPGEINVKAGSKLKLDLVNKTGAGCIQAFTIPQLNIQKIVPVGTTQTLEFTAPNEQGQLPFMCSMGMFRGVINVI